LGCIPVLCFSEVTTVQSFEIAEAKTNESASGVV
jgi:hypothetical protein